MIEFAERIYVARHTSTVGAAIVRQLKQQGISRHQLLLPAELDLTSQAHVNDFFEATQPDMVYLPMAVATPNEQPAGALQEELNSLVNVMGAAFRSKVERLLLVGGAGVYPSQALQPMSEEELNNGPVSPNSNDLSVAQMVGIRLCESFNLQTRDPAPDYRCVIACEGFGLTASGEVPTSTLVGSLIAQIHHAKQSGELFLIIQGNGDARYELLYVDDLADACVHMMQAPRVTYHEKCHPLVHVNIGSGIDLSLSELTHVLARELDYRGHVAFDDDPSRVDERRLLDCRRANSLGWSPFVEVEEGLQLVCQQYRYKGALRVRVDSKVSEMQLQGTGLLAPDQSHSPVPHPCTEVCPPGAAEPQ